MDMKKCIFLLSLIALVAFSWSCKSSADTATSAAPGDTVMAGIERGPCFGRCPQYKAMFYTTGFATYEGIRNTSREGVYNARLSQEMLLEIKDALSRNNMAAADSEYVNKLLADYPAFWLWISDKKGSRKIHVNHEKPPVTIDDYAHTMDNLIERIDWKLVSGPSTDK